MLYVCEEYAFKWHFGLNYKKWPKLEYYCLPNISKNVSEYI